MYNDGGTVTLTNSTVSGNSAGDDDDGGGVFNRYGTATLTNSTVSGNSAGGLWRRRVERPLWHRDPDQQHRLGQ